MIFPKIVTIIINWRQPETTMECVHSLQAMDGPRPDILVIDNGSGDHSIPFLQKNLSPNQLLSLPQNNGFAGGANIGMRYALDNGYDFALLINNDAFPASSMLIKLLAEVKPDIGLLSPKILYEASPELIWFAGGQQDAKLLELRDRSQGEPDGPKWAASRDVDYLLGACLLVNLQVAASVGLFDEHYFMYYEDLDWSIRLRQAGYRLRMVGDAVLYHRVAVSSGGEDSPNRRRYLAQSSVYFFWQHRRGGSPIAILLFRLGSALRTITRLLLQGKWDTAVAYVQGLYSGLRLVNQCKKEEKIA